MTEVAASTGLNLDKGQRVDLTKTNPNLKLAHVGLGWDTNQSGSGAAYDLDAFAFLLGADKKLIEGQKGVIFFNHKEEFGVKHGGDNLTGAGDGDDETVIIDISKLDPRCQEIIIGVNIFQAVERKQNFGQVNNAFIRIYNGEGDPKTAIMKFDLSENYSAFNAMLMGKLYKNEGEWKFQALGEGKNGTINDLSAGF